MGVFSFVKKIPDIKSQIRNVGKGIRFLPYMTSCWKCGGKLEKDGEHWTCQRCGWTTRERVKKVGIIEKALFYINGWKTVTGLAVWGLGLLVTGPAAPWLVVCGQILSTGGVIHKSAKGINNLLTKRGKEETGKNLLDLLKQIWKIIKKIFSKGGE